MEKCCAQRFRREEERERVLYLLKGNSEQGHVETYLLGEMLEQFTEIAYFFPRYNDIFSPSLPAVSHTDVLEYFVEYEPKIQIYSRGGLDKNKMKSKYSG